MSFLDNDALNVVREAAGDTTTTSTSTGEDTTYGEYMDDNPVLKTVEEVASGGSIPEEERNLSIEEAKEKIDTGFRDIITDAGLDPDNPELMPDNTGAFNNDLEDIWNNNTPDIGDAGQKINDLVNPVVGLIPGGQTDTGDTGGGDNNGGGSMIPQSLKPFILPTVAAAFGYILLRGGKK